MEAPLLPDVLERLVAAGVLVRTEGKTPGYLPACSPAGIPLDRIAAAVMPEAGADPDQVEVGGVAFVHFHAEDAAMSHYQQVDGYRSVRNGRCVAIDLMVGGTRPEVHDPPRTPPFTVSVARVRLQQALAAVHWDD